MVEMVEIVNSCSTVLIQILMPSTLALREMLVVVVARVGVSFFRREGF
jgi:hypothetical protein